MDLTPIETQYKGYRFRSRLEARWAIFLDAIGIAWEYEREGYELPSGRYLPDFWLPQVKMWAEVKPGDFNCLEYQRCKELFRHTGYPVLLLDGQPDYRSYRECAPDNEWETDYILDARYLDENRFFSSTGYDSCIDPELRSDLERDEAYRKAIETCRSARFEYGESGPQAARSHR